MASSFFDDAGFQDVRNLERSSNLGAADDRTLRMAALPLDGPMLDGLVRYQETWLSHAEGGQGSEALAKAHTEALAASGLPQKTVERGIAMLRAFSGRRSALRKFQDKLRQLEGRSGPEVDELRTRINEELRKQERATEDLARRYGAEPLALLRAREDVLVDLHTRVTRLLSRG